MLSDIGVWLKGIVLPKLKILSLITNSHVIPNPKDLRSFSEDVFELSDPPIETDRKDPNTIKAQKRSKDIVKLMHVPSVVQSSFYEAMRILCMQKKHFIQQFASSLSLYSAILESMRKQRMQQMYTDTLFVVTFLCLDHGRTLAVYGESESLI